MDRHIIIFTADKRLSDLGNLLAGRRVRCSFEEYRRKKQEEVHAEKVYVFPTPVNKLENYPDIQKQLKEELIREGAQCVFGGMFDGAWRAFFKENHISYVDFLEVDEVVTTNARITAEAVIAELLTLSPYSIQKQKVIVTGFGACARPIAENISALGADVIIVARNESARQMAKKLGFEVSSFKEWDKIVGNVTAIINTVPALVVTKAIIEKMSKEAVILDIASKPGGTDFESAKEFGVISKLALGLPGIYSTQSSAYALKNAMWEYAPLQELERGEQSWIFQIII